MEAEAKDNFKYMKSLQASYVPLYTGTPHDIIANLPAIMKAFHTLHSTARSVSSEGNTEQIPQALDKACSCDTFSASTSI